MKYAFFRAYVNFLYHIYMYLDVCICNSMIQSCGVILGMSQTVSTVATSWKMPGTMFPEALWVRIGVGIPLRTSRGTVQNCEDILVNNGGTPLVFFMMIVDKTLIFLRMLT